MKLLACLCLILFAGCSRPAKDSVVLYTSQDQFYAEPILKEFTAATGIEVRPVFDTESAKTAGLAHRLRAEAPNPQCDVFWSNEEMHTRLLVRDGVVRPENWKAVGSRTRRLVINTNLITSDQLPKSLLELTNEVWKGRVALAYPLFGTTQSHFLALRQLWGEEQWSNWSRGLVRNRAKVVDGNSVVVKLVGAGECAIGLTDSDDIAAGLRQGLPIRAAELNREFIAIPSTIAIIRDSPTAQGLADYLSKPETLKRMVFLGALESIETQGDASPLYRMDWSGALEAADAANEALKLIFIRS